ncbi:polysaccharide deacetylase family protein [uncultured Amaricoccus sp.]|uniref:polysaccharide deacetylase family protein n=2 Tax=Amaricoccus TaxID=56999 RepID=UPI002626CBCB|nr:polysaccharide deacetylase family protein [uncultured Amaricoccus sp.]
MFEGKPTWPGPGAGDAPPTPKEVFGETRGAEISMAEISVIVACYNGAETLGETLESLVRQDWDRPWEIVFADNGSTDASAAIFAETARRHPGVRMRRVDASAEKGKVFALNTGIRAAKGRALLFCDADDTVAPGWLAAMGAALDAAPLVAARMDVRVLNPDWAVGQRRQQQETGLGFIPHAPFSPMAGGATLGFHREVFEAVGGFDPAFRVMEDDDFCVRVHLAGYDMKYVPDAVYNYRFRLDPASIYRQGYQYSYFRGLMRRRYAPGNRWAPGPWIALLARVGRLRGALLKDALLRRERPADDQARIQRALGGAVGDLAGSLAFGVAPPEPSPPAPPSSGQPAAGRTPPPPTSPKLLARARGLARRVAHRALRPVAGSILSARLAEKRMALTFDDGPDPETTPAVLDALARHGMRATFFLVGERAARYPELVARIAAEGHEIGNHGWDHPSLPTLPAAAVREQIARTRATLAPHGQALMRPPYGDQSLATHLAARRLGYKVVIWSVVGRDWLDEDAEAIAGRILAEAAPGAIALLHDTLYSFAEERHRDRGPTIGALALLRARLPDYSFVTVSELLAAGRPVTRYWVRAPKAGWLAGLSVAEGDRDHRVAEGDGDHAAR